MTGVSTGVTEVTLSRGSRGNVLQFLVREGGKQLDISAFFKHVFFKIMA